MVLCPSLGLTGLGPVRPSGNPPQYGADRHHAADATPVQRSHHLLPTQEQEAAIRCRDQKRIERFGRQGRLPFLRGPHCVKGASSPNSSQLRPERPPNICARPPLSSQMLQTERPPNARVRPPLSSQMLRDFGAIFLAGHPPKRPCRSDRAGGEVTRTSQPQINHNDKDDGP